MPLWCLRPNSAVQVGCSKAEQGPSWVLWGSLPFRSSLFNRAREVDQMPEELQDLVPMKSSQLVVTSDQERNLVFLSRDSVR